MSVELPHPNQFETVATPEIETRSTRVQYDFDSLVARNGMVFAFVDYLFDDSTENSDLYGAVGTSMRPVHEDEVERRREQYKDPNESPLRHVYEESEATQSWKDWIEGELRANGIDLLFNQSFLYKYGDVVREQCDEEALMNPDKIGAIECIDNSRMFTDLNGDHSKVYDEELLRIVKEVEESGLYALDL